MVIVQSGGRLFALPQQEVQAIERIEGLTALSLAALLENGDGCERYGLLIGDDVATMVTVASVDLVTTEEPLPLPEFVRRLAHPVVSGVVLYQDQLIPVLDAMLLQDAV